MVADCQRNFFTLVGYDLVNYTRVKFPWAEHGLHNQYAGFLTERADEFRASIENPVEERDVILVVTVAKTSPMTRNPKGTSGGEGDV